MVAALYDNPSFNVKQEGVTSDTKKQETGIRQGCPLSPYLFLAVMTAIWHDIHGQLEIINLDGRKKRHEGLKWDPLPFSEILYADDTILLGLTSATVETQLKLLITEAARYGLNLNMGKCEHIKVNTKDSVHFPCGTDSMRSIRRNTSGYSCTKAHSQKWT